MTPDQGSFPLSDAGDLPNVTVAFPGEHWSDGKASEAIVPGEAIVPLNSGGKLYWQRAASGTLDPRTAIALRTVQVPDVNTGPTALGPNEIMNQEIAVGEYVHAYYSGSFHLTLVYPSDSYAPGDLLMFDKTIARPSSKGGVGAWRKTAVAAQALLEVVEVRSAGSDDIVTVRSLRGQF